MRRVAQAGLLGDKSGDVQAAKSQGKAERLCAGAEYDEPFLASLIPGRVVKTFSRHTLRKRFRTACKALGAARLEALTIHHGRHTFISHGLAGGRTLAEVRDAAGHANVSVTSGYLHVAVEDEAGVGNLFRIAWSVARTPSLWLALAGVFTRTDQMKYGRSLPLCNRA